MSLLCAYCGKVADLDAIPGDAPVDSGMCPACFAWFRPFWEGLGLGEFLERFDLPVIVTDGHARVIASNGRGAARLGRDRNELVGRLAGDAVLCLNARRPGGCGRTVHCRECTLRRTIDAARAGGRAVEGVEAYLDTAVGRVPLRVSARPIGDAVRVIVEETGLPEPIDR